MVSDMRASLKTVRETGLSKVMTGSLGILGESAVATKATSKVNNARCSLYTLRRDLANCNRKREPVFFAFLRERLAIGVIMRLDFPDKEEQAWSECPMPARRSAYG